MVSVNQVTPAVFIINKRKISTSSTQGCQTELAAIDVLARNTVTDNENNINQVWNLLQIPPQTDSK